MQLGSLASIQTYPVLSVDPLEIELGQHFASKSHQTMTIPHYSPILLFKLLTHDIHLISPTFQGHIQQDTQLKWNLPGPWALVCTSGPS